MEYLPDVLHLGDKTAIGTHACGFKPWFRKEMPWNLEQTPIPQSHHHGEHEKVATNATIRIDQVIARTKALGFTQYRVAFPRGETGVYTVSANTMAGDIVDPRDDRTAHFDQYSGALLTEVTWQDYSPFAKAMAARISLHQGDLSVWNKIANVLFCLAFILICHRCSDGSCAARPVKLG